MIGLVLLVSVGGGLGAVVRFVIDGAVRVRVGGAFPIGTVMINVTGSFLLGVITGLALSRTVSEQVRLVAGTGFLGGYTTFSTASFETVRLVQERRIGAALLNGLGTLVGATLAAFAGFALVLPG